MTIWRMRVAASVALGLGLGLAAAFPLLVDSRRPSDSGLLCAIAELWLVLPGCVLTVSLLLRHEPSPIVRMLGTLVLPAGLIWHAATLLAPAAGFKRMSFGGPPDVFISYGNQVFLEALWFLPNTSGIPWWAANLVFVLFPFTSSVLSKNPKRFLIFLAASFALVAWLPYLDRGNDVWKQHIAGLLWGYYAWAICITAMSAVLVTSVYLGKRTSGKLQ